MNVRLHSRKSEPASATPATGVVDFSAWFQAAHPDVSLAGALATIKLAGEGATIPFIARYRKEQTGNLDEVKIQQAIDARETWDRLLARQTFIVEEIERQKKLTPELRARILSTYDEDALEDLYLPYKLKRKTKATVAREAGLQQLADWIWACGHGTEEPQPGQTLELWAFTFRNAEKGFPDAESAIQGAQDILVERLAETAELRQLVRTEAFDKGVLRSKKGDEAKPNSKFDKYFDSFEPIASLRQAKSSHRYLAMRRGLAEKELSLAITGPPDDEAFEPRLQAAFDAAACSVPESPGAAVLQRASRLALKASVLPAIETEVHRVLKDVADEVAIQVFAENLRQLLLASPFGSKAVLGVDPGLRTGCKLVVVEASGAYLASDVIHLESEGGRAQAGKLLAEVLKTANVQAIAVGNGTAGRETEAFLRAALRAQGLAIPVVMVSESGASVYSASPVAREEFPELDVTVRGAISIARRLQDPLAELVKIDPKSIGVGQYQHDVAAGSLKKSLELVVDSCVNQVGVNLNTASYHLLAHVSGIGPSLAKAVVVHRGKRGLFTSRAQLLQVPRFSSKTFEQAAGFLRIAGGEHPLDNTGVHPERYPMLDALAARLERNVADLLGKGVDLVRADTALRDEVGKFTFDDIVAELAKPGRDPREEFVPFAYRDDVLDMKDLKPGMKCPGIVTNVTNFGAFVDIGVHHDGLVHVSQISDRFVKDPREVVHPGKHVQVRVLEVNLQKQQIALTMKSEPVPRAAPAPRPPRADKPRRPAAAPAQQQRPENRPERKPDRRPERRPDRKPETRPQGPRPAPASSAPARGASGHTRPPQPAGTRPGQPPPRKPQPSPPPSSSSQPRFVNNPFASLAALKKDKPS